MLYGHRAFQRRMSFEIYSLKTVGGFSGSGLVRNSCSCCAHLAMTMPTRPNTTAAQRRIRWSARGRLSLLSITPTIPAMPIRQRDVQNRFRLACTRSASTPCANSRRRCSDLCHQLFIRGLAANPDYCKLSVRAAHLREYRPLRLRAGDGNGQHRGSAALRAGGRAEGGRPYMNRVALAAKFGEGLLGFRVVGAELYCFF
jgi:hypothetical protein